MNKAGQLAIIAIIKFPDPLIMKQFLFPCLFLIAIQSFPLVSQHSPGLPVPNQEDLSLKKSDHYSPYAGRNFPTAVFWGDTHLHTGMSMDAGAFGARLRPDDAYRFASGEEVTSSTGLQVKLSRALDFLVVADHSDNMGFFPRLYSGDPDMLKDPTGKKWYDMVRAGGQQGVQAAIEIIEGFSQGTFPTALDSRPGDPGFQSAWEETMEAVSYTHLRAHET